MQVFKRIEPPKEEPVTLDQARRHLRIVAGDTSQDELITGLIQAAREYAEDYTRRAFVQQRWQLVLDQFPGYGFFASALWAPFGFGASSGFGDYLTTGYSVIATRGNEILLHTPPLLKLITIEYIDTGGNLQLLPETEYILGDSSEPARITPAYGKWWPPTRPQIESVTVTYDCGFGAGADVPEAIKRWMLLRIGAMYEHREEIVIDKRIAQVDLPFVDSLLDTWRVFRL